MNISEIFIRRPIATSLLMAGVVLMGLLGYAWLFTVTVKKTVKRKSQILIYKVPVSPAIAG